MFRWRSVAGSEPLARILAAFHDAVSEIPVSSEPRSVDPRARARELGNAACLKAAAVSGSLAIAPGPLGLLTLLPDLLLIWRIQGRLVADVAAAYGKTVLLTREGMIHCLFKHAAAQAVRDIVVRSGERLLIRRAASPVLQKVLEGITFRTSERLASRAFSRWLPVLGAIGVGAFAWRDTHEIAKTAIETFSADVTVEDAA